MDYVKQGQGNWNMTGSVNLCENRAQSALVALHLRACDAGFEPPLSERLVIDDYALKITRFAQRFEAWSGEEFVGLVAAYCNDHKSGVAYITSVSVKPDWRGQGIAAQLLLRCVEHVRRLGLSRVDLEVDDRNTQAISLYSKYGFATVKSHAHALTMSLSVGEEGHG